MMIDRACRRTLNYDLLLYWAQMHNEEGNEPSSDDGFRKPEDDYDAAYVTWESGNSHKQNTWFLHGALHLFDAGTEIQKYTWVNTGLRLIDQIRDALKRDYFPTFVAEGTSNEKLIRIRHNDYLANHRVTRWLTTHAVKEHEVLIIKLGYDSDS
jgi:hypothetical protein